MGILFGACNNACCLDSADFHCRVDHDTLRDSTSIPYCQSTQCRFSSRTHCRVLLAEYILCWEWQQNQRRVNHPALNIEFLWQLVSTIDADIWITSPRRSNRSRKRSIALWFRKLPVWRQKPRRCGRRQLRETPALLQSRECDHSVSNLAIARIDRSANGRKLFRSLNQDRVGHC